MNSSIKTLPIKTTPIKIPAGRSRLSSVTALLGLALRQQLRGRRPLVLGLLFVLPTGLIVLLRAVGERVPTDMLQAVFVFGLIPHVLAPLAALLYATGVVQDELEEQTLTYLLLRPIPRWLIYVVKILASIATTSLLASAGTALVYTAIAWGAADGTEGLTTRILKTCLLLTVCQVAYASLFGLISLLTRRSVIAGIAYIVAIEGLASNWEFVIREFTVVYYFRVLSIRWLHPAHTEPWGINLDDAPTTAMCLLRVIGLPLLLILLGGALLQNREFGMKTPESSGA